MTSTRFSSERQPTGRPPRGKDKRTLVLDALRAELGEGAPETEFYKLCAKRAMKPEDPASSMLMKELFVRLYPAAKPVMPSITFDYPANGTPSEKIEAVSQAIAEGDLTADVGKILVDIILASVKVFEVTELAERLARIEEMLNRGESA